MANKSRPKQLSFRVSEEEYQQLQEKISKSGKNQQEYILSCVLEKQIVNTDGIKELIPELKRIGNNLNQIAKRSARHPTAGVRSHPGRKRPLLELPDGLFLPDGVPLRSHRL